MDDIENIRKNYDVFRGESGDFMLKPKKPRNDFQDISTASTSAGGSSSYASSMIVDENELITVPITAQNSNSIITVQTSNSMETSGQV